MPPGKAVAAKAANAASKAAASAAAAKKGASSARTTPMNKMQRPPKLHPVSPTLRVFLGGVAETTRTNTVKQLWDYIKTHQLQDPQDPKEINCDEKLKLVLGKDRVNFKEIFGLISPHFPKVDKKS